jgi:hypothetical protein
VNKPLPEIVFEVIEIGEDTRRNDAADGIIELPSFPFDRKVVTDERV